MQGLEEVNEGDWARARLIAFYAYLPHTKKSARLKMTDLLELPTFDKKRTVATSKPARAYRLTPEEIKAWYSGTWLPPDKQIKA